jgi:phosphoribosylamine--glycine ligase
VVVCDDRAEAERTVKAFMTDRLHGEAGSTVLIEAFLRGREVSMLALCSGERFALLAPARDHKSLLDGGRGPNTGGMGAVTPVADVDRRLEQRVAAEVFRPLLKRLAEIGTPYYGLLYAGLMVDAAGAPWVLEFNVRLGDPEAEALLMHLDGDLLPHLEAVARRSWCDVPLAWKPGATVAVVLAAPGYPAAPVTGQTLSLPEAGAASGVDAERVKRFHGATARSSSAAAGFW